MTVEEYLDKLMNGDGEDPSMELDCEVASQVTEEMSKIADEVELEWLEPTAKNITFWSEPTLIIANYCSRHPWELRRQWLD